MNIRLEGTTFRGQVLMRQCSMRWSFIRNIWSKSFVILVSRRPGTCYTDSGPYKRTTYFIGSQARMTKLAFVIGDCRALLAMTRRRITLPVLVGGILHRRYLRFLSQD